MTWIVTDSQARALADEIAATLRPLGIHVVYRGTDGHTLSVGLQVPAPVLEVHV